LTKEEEKGGRGRRRRKKKHKFMSRSPRVEKDGKRLR